MSIHAIVEELEDIEDVDLTGIADTYVLYWDNASSTWKVKAIWVAAHKDSHDPQDGSDKLDTAAPVKVGAANAIGTSHSLARADHVHEREHAIYTDAAAKAAAVQAGAITDTVTKAPTHDAVYDVKATAEAAMPSADDAAAAVAAMGAEGDANPLNHAKYLDAAAKAAAVQAGAITDAVTKAPTHDAVYDVKVTADAAQPAATDAAAAVAAVAAIGGVFVPLGTSICIYRATNVSSSPRTATVSSVTDNVITLTANEAYRFWNAAMNGYVYLKIANTTKEPVEYAWVSGTTAVNKLTVTDADDISGWALNDVISTAEDGAASAYIELDISPSIPATATLINVLVHAQDSGTISATVDHACFGTVGGPSLSQYCQVSGLGNRIMGVVPITGQKCFARDRASAANTGNFGLYISAYLR